MRRRFMILSVLAAALALAGCVGDTDPATNITSKTAQLNAHGRTNDGPASWWWEYSTSKSTVEANGGAEVCGSPPEADGRCGPAQGPSGTDVPLSFKLTGLTPGTTYWFRVCGQDVNDANPTCGRVLSFTTLAEYYVFDRRWGSLGSGDGQFNHPIGVAVRDGNVYVADYDNHRVQKFSSSGGFLAKWGSLGTGDGQFDHPAGIAIDTEAIGTAIYVADSATGGCSSSNSSGGFLRKWGSFGTGDGQFHTPIGIATQLEESGGIPLVRTYVSDFDLDRIQKFDCCGAFFSKLGTFGSDYGRFDRPYGLAVRGANGFVADYGNDRIQRFNTNGFSFSLVRWEVSDPRGVGVDSSGNVYVTSWPGEIRKFTRTARPSRDGEAAAAATPSSPPRMRWPWTPLATST